jgi:predicted RNA-binding Zn-ribbon protein involved in translation (DUF1610 family)
MSMFRHKPKKLHSSGKDITTLDTEHKKKLLEFKKMKDSLPVKKKQLEETRQELYKLNHKDSSTYTPNDIKTKADLKDNIDIITTEIENIISNKDEMNYYANTIDILSDYYDETDPGHEEPPKMANSIMDFFNSGQQSSKSSVGKNNRASLLDSYKTRTDSSYVSKNKTHNFVQQCDTCKVEKILNQSDALYECINCGETEIVIIESDRPNYKDPIPDNSAYAYRRINHQPLLCCVY